VGGKNLSLDFKEDNLIDLCELVTDGSHHSPPSQVEGYYMASVKDMGAYKFIYSDCRKISEEDYDKLVKSGCSPKNEDILIAKDGSPLSNIFIYQEEYPMVLLSSIAIIRTNKNKILPEFLKYYLENPSIKKYIQTTYTSGSVIPRIILKDFKKFPINYPDIANQKKIIGVLKSIDEKIAINEEINKNLFELSNVLHYDFIKSIDNNNECSYIDLKELGNIVMGQSPKGESYNYDNIGLPLINGAADYENGYLKAQKYTSAPKKTCDKNDLIFCIRATIGLLVVCDKKYCLGRGVAGITNINPTYKEYAFHIINSSIENFKRAATGSVISGISRKDIETIDVKIPSSDEINKYHSIQKPIFDKLENNRIEINKLIKLRDTLLPKLMSGEINVSKINCDLE